VSRSTFSSCIAPISTDHDGHALALDARQHERIHVAQFQQDGAQCLQAVLRHRAVADGVARDDFGDRPHRARRAVGGVPALGVVQRRGVFEARARGRDGGVEVVRRDAAIREIGQRLRLGADAEGFNEPDVAPGAGDDFGRAAADVDDQAALVVTLDRACHAHVDQAPFFLARDDVDRVPDRVLGQRQQQVGVLRHPHRVGGDDTHGV